MNAHRDTGGCELQDDEDWSWLHRYDPPDFFAVSANNPDFIHPAFPEDRGFRRLAWIGAGCFCAAFWICVVGFFAWGWP